MLGFVALGAMLGSITAAVCGAPTGVYLPIGISALIVAAAVFFSVIQTRNEVDAPAPPYFDPVNPGAASSSARTKTAHEDSFWFSVQPLNGGQKAVAAGLVVVSLVGALIPVAGLVTRVATNVVTGNWAAFSLLANDDQQRAVDELIDYIGSPMVVDIRFMPDYVVVAAPSAPGATTIDRYKWTYNGVTREGPNSYQPDDLEEVLFDASTLDYSAVRDIWQISVADAGLDTYERNGIDVSRGLLSPEDGAQLSVSFSHPYGSTYLTYSFDRELLSKSE